MKLLFDKNLSKEVVYATGSELASVMGFDKDKNGNRIIDYPHDKEFKVVSFLNPILITDNYKISKLNSVLRDTVFSIFGKSWKRVVYDNVSLDFNFDKYKGVWSPSIDTLFFCKSLKKINLKKTKRVIEIGSGSGFISKYVLEKYPNLKEVIGIDLNRYSMDCAKDNIKDKRFDFFVGDAIEFLKGRSYDLVLCNPPYIPRKTSIDDNPYEGLKLICYLIQNTNNFLTKNGKLIINISSLSWDIVKSCLKENNLEYKIINKMHVPLKVFNVLNNKSWMNYLLKRGLKKQTKKGYDYWHDLILLEIVNN